MEMNKTRALFQAIKEMIKYGCVGILSTAANLAMFWMLESAGLFYIAANAIAYFGAVIINFYLNEWLVFIQDDEKRQWTAASFPSDQSDISWRGQPSFLSVCGYSDASAVPEPDRADLS